ncbi:MAG: low temperature requirement protein A [Solirubrobacterales bacterium]|nr:low temperature requirement protein A [Solirubrobacterales bacterium]
MSRFALRRNPDEEYRASSLELFFDLVFVFAVTQVSHLLIEHLSWKGALESGIALLVVWWAWQYTVWATNEFDAEQIPIRLLLIVIMMASLLMAIAIPEAFGDRGLLFASAYVFIQVFRHAFMTFVAADRGTVERRRAAHILTWFCAGGVFWIAGGIAEGDARILLWLVALAIDYGGPLVTFRVPWMEPIETGDWNVGGSHFAERFQLFTIIALGETIVLTGATTAGLELDGGTITAFGFAFVSTVCLWWLYFNYIATRFERMLVDADDRTLAGRDMYTYGHVPIIAGIILCAVGDELVIAHPSAVLEPSHLLAVVAGPVLYLLSFLPIRWRLTRGVPMKRLVGAAACVAIGLIAHAAEFSAVLVGGLLCAVLVAVVVTETARPVHPDEPVRAGADAAE